MDLFFIGLILVGAILSMKVFTEGKTHMDHLSYRLKEYRKITQQVIEKTQEYEQKNNQVKSTIEKLTLEINTLKNTRNQMRDQTRDLKSKMGQSHKIHL